MTALKKCCIDSCVWIKYAGHLRIYTLLQLIAKNRLTVYADNYLLGEVHDALSKNFDFTMKEADEVIRLICTGVIVAAPMNRYRLANDPEDNFLYDLCIQNNCRYLITIDKGLLEDSLAPFLRKTDAWLKRRKK